MIPKLIPLPRMIEPKNAVLVLRYPMVSPVRPNAIATPSKVGKKI